MLLVTFLETTSTTRLYFFLHKLYFLIVFTCKCFLHERVLDETTTTCDLSNVLHFGRLNLRGLWGLASSTILLKVSGSDLRPWQTMQQVTEAMIPMVAMLLATAAAIMSTDRVDSSFPCGSLAQDYRVGAAPFPD